MGTFETTTKQRLLLKSAAIFWAFRFSYSAVVLKVRNCYFFKNIFLGVVFTTWNTKQPLIQLKYQTVFSSNSSGYLSQDSPPRILYYCIVCIKPSLDKTLCLEGMLRASSKHSGYICQYAGSDIWSVLLGSVMFVNLYIFCIVMFLLLFIAFFVKPLKREDY